MKCASETWKEVFVLNELSFETLEDSCTSDREIPIIIVRNVLKYPEQVREFMENGYWWDNGGDPDCARPGKSFDFGPNIETYFTPLTDQLTKFYDVNPEFRSGDDIYAFDEKNGTFVIDGNGVDTIENSASHQNSFIDLRPGTHSYEGQKSSFITAAKQLTISHGSEIENVYTGLGDDTVIGNHLNNIVDTGDGDDIIFAGEGADIIYPGAGRNIVDLSEDLILQDTVVIEKISPKDYDIIYGFTQGILGDVLDVTTLNLSSLTVLSIVDILNVPSGYIDNCLVRIFGEGLNDANSVATNFISTGSLKDLKLSLGATAILITANSQGTGEAQDVYTVNRSLDFVDVYHLAQFVGNYLDLDNWSGENFLV